MATLAERLTMHSAPAANGCVEWQRARDRDGYGIIQVAGRPQRAHRMAWEVEHGPIPAGLVVMHSCDNPSCVLLEHLSLGTVADNNADRSRKGRTTRSGPRSPFHPLGVLHPMVKLTEAQVVEIRRRVAAGEVQRRLADEFGLSPSGICRIVKARTWSHLEEVA